MRTPRRLLATVLAMAALAACADDPTTSAPANPAASTTADSDTVTPPADGDLYGGEKDLLELSRQIPGFAGVSYEGETRVVRLTAAGDPAEASRVLAGYAPAEQGDRPDAKTGASTRFVPAEFDYPTLRSFRDSSIDPVLEVEGTTFFDLDEASNRLVVGIVDETARAEVQARFARAGVPAEATEVVVTGPMEDDITLQQQWQPLEGGWQIQNANNGTCTLGFITRNPSNGAPSFVTASHCTGALWSLDGIAFSQPINPLWVGREVRDPRPFACFWFYRCRYSDAALVQVNTNVAVAPNRIGRTLGWGGPGAWGSITIDPANPRFAVTAVQNWPWAGQMVDKVGRTSGWNYGFVRRTCVTVPIAPWRRALCQYSANYASAGGDSGAPVFLWHGNNVTLTGLHWRHSKFESFFSAAGGIRIDLGVP
ncbi:MAG TPA: hypothetical protein VF584_16700 [Longimicrobium sp.]